MRRGRFIACLLLAALPAGDLLARTPLPVETDGTGSSELALAAKKHKKPQKRPIELGTSGGSVEDFTVVPPNIACCGGTLGALLEKEGGLYILSNNHVLGRLNQAEIGESISQPGLNDTKCESKGKDVVGVFAGSKRLKLNGTNKADVAIAATSPDMVSADGSILGLGIPGNDTVKPKVGAAVVKSGRTTGVTRSFVRDVNVTGFVTFPKACGDDSEESVRFKKVFLIAGGDFSAGGDSGSVIYEDTAKCPRAMGLLFAGTDDFTAANRMTDVLKAVKKIAPKGRAKLVGCDPGASARFGESEAGVAREGLTRGQRDELRAERRAVRIQRWAEDDILATPGVVAMGIGRAGNGRGEARDSLEVVFRVFVEDARPETAAAVPRNIDGVPVEIVVSGRLRALRCPGEAGGRVAIGGLETAAGN